MMKAISKSLGLVSTSDPLAFQAIESMGHAFDEPDIIEERSIELLLSLYQSGFEAELSEAEIERVNAFVATGSEGN